MSIVSISNAHHLRLGSVNCDVSWLKDEDTYITVFGYGQKEMYLENLQKHTNVLYVSPKAINRFHGGDSLRQTIVVFEKKCPDQSEPKPALGVSKEVTTPEETT